jgi:serine/threonine protein kinase
MGSGSATSAFTDDHVAGDAQASSRRRCAPEQAKGRVVDKRADIWAFGCVLYEMLTGRRAFEGDDVSDTLASILKSDADWTGVPPPVRRLLKKCLEKDPRKRLHDIGDAWDLLDDQATRIDRAPSRSSWLPWTLAALLLLSTIALVAMRFMQPAVTPSSARFQIEPPPNHNFDTYVALSPDGKRVAFTAADDRREVTLWVRDLESLQARQLPGTGKATSPFW